MKNKLIQILKFDYISCGWRSETVLKSGAKIITAGKHLMCLFFFLHVRLSISCPYAPQQHETFLPGGDRAAYLIGDGAGVGKGRTIAGIIYENYLLGRKRSLW